MEFFVYKMTATQVIFMTFCFLPALYTVSYYKMSRDQISIAEEAITAMHMVVGAVRRDRGSGGVCPTTCERFFLLF